MLMFVTLVANIVFHFIIYYIFFLLLMLILDIPSVEILQMYVYIYFGYIARNRIGNA